MKYHLTTAAVALLIAAAFVACVRWNVLAHQWYGIQAPLTFIPSATAALFLLLFVQWVTHRINR